MTHPKARTRGRTIASTPRAILIVYLLYTGTGALGLGLLHRLAAPEVAAVSDMLIVPWLPVGFGIAGLMHFGRRAWPGVTLGSLTVWGALQDDPWISVVPDAIGESLSILLIVVLLRRWDFRWRLDRYRDAAVLVGTVMLGRIVAIMIDLIVALPLAARDPHGQQLLQAGGATKLTLSAFLAAPILKFTLRWWANSVIGAVLVVPLLQFVEEPTRALGARPLRASLTAALLVLGWSAGMVALPGEGWRVPLILAQLGFVAWTVQRHGAAWAAVVIFGTSLATTLAVAFRLGPFSGLPAASALLMSWAALSLITGIALFLTGLMGEVQRARADLEATVARLRALFDRSPLPMWIETTDGVIVRANVATERTYGRSPSQLQGLRSTALVIGALDTGALADFDVGAAAAAERHLRADGAVIPVAVLRVPLLLPEGQLRCCIIEPLAERMDLHALTIGASDLERIRLATDLAHSIQPAVRRLQHRAKEVVRALEQGRAPDESTLNGMADDAADAIQHCRRVTRGISPLGDDGDLAAALKALPETFEDGAVKVLVNVSDNVPDLTSERAEQLYRIAEEAVRIAISLPATTYVAVHLSIDEPPLRLTIESDGSAGAPFDLRSLRARALVAGVQLSVNAPAGGGLHLAFVERAATETTSPSEAKRSFVHAEPLAPVEHSALWSLFVAAGFLAALIVGGAASYLVASTAPTRHASWDTGLMVVPAVANGIAVVGIWLGGWRRAPLIVAGSIIVWGGIADDSWFAVLPNAVAEAAAALLTVSLLRRFGFSRSLDRYRDLIALVAAAALGCSLPFAIDTLGSLLGAIFMPALAERELGVGISNDVLLYTVLRVAASANLNWWLGGVLSVVLLVPAVLGMSVEARARFVQGRLELLSLVLAHLALIALILGFPYFESRTLIAVCSILIGGWAGVRFGTQAAAWSATAYTIALAGASAWHVGVFQSTPFPLSAIVAWRGICLNVTITFFMSVLVARQRSLLAELTSFAAEYQGLFDALRQAVIVFERPSGRIVLANRAAQERFDCRPGDGGTSRIEDLDVTEGGGRSELLVAPVVAGIEREFRETTGETCIVEVWATDITLDERPARLCFAINVSNRTKLRARLMAAEGKARQALARDLHDGLGQALTGLALGVSALSRSAIGVSKALHSARFVERAAEEIQRDAERLVLGVSPLASANGDLVEAVRRLPETLPPTARGQLAVEITASAPVALTLTQCDHLYQLVREATNNAVKHARARRIVVHLRVAGDWVDATVSDDGIGLGDPVSPAGLGLSSMASRATLLRAVFSIGPGPRGGTTMSCRAANAPIATAEPTPVGAETPDARSRPVAL